MADLDEESLKAIKAPSEDKTSNGDAGARAEMQFYEKAKKAKYDPAEDRESARRALAYILIGLLCAVAIAYGAAAFWRPEAVGPLKDLLTIILTLTSSILGFYFAEMKNRSGR